MWPNIIFQPLSLALNDRCKGLGARRAASPRREGEEAALSKMRASARVGNFRKQRTMAWGALGIVLAGAFAAWALGVRERATIVTVKPSETYQVMTGWEVTARAWEKDKVANRFDGSWLDFRDEIIAVLADEAGINRIRLEVR